jgi:aminopeptidase N
VSNGDNLYRDEARERARLLSDVRYDVRLDLTQPASPTFSSTTTVRFSCAQPGASTFIDLDAEAVRAASLNGAAIDPATFTGVRLQLDGLAADNELVVTAECRYQHTGVGLHRFTDPVDEQVYLYTQFEPFDAHRVFACFDQPDLKAPFTLAVDAPPGWVVVSNGAVAAQPPDGQGGRWSFATTEAMSTYITALVAGPYHQVRQQFGDIDMGVYCRTSLAEHLDAEEIFEITRQGFEFFTQDFAFPYPFGRSQDGRRKYDQLFVPEFNAGAMENAACVTFSESYVFRSKVTEANRRRRAETILHEMAHMWFGDLVTMRWWDDLWLNESFATYMAYRALVSATRFTDAWSDFAADLKAWAYNQDQLPSTHPIVADMVDTDAVRTNFDGITYAKGASVLRQLVAWVGEEAFMRGLRGYFQRHQYGNAELRDFLAALEDSSGRDLREWSQQWLQTAGVTTLRPQVEVDGDHYRTVEIRQEAPDEHPTMRDHRAALGLYDLSGEGLQRRRAVELDVTGASTRVDALDGERVADLLLLNDGDLAYAKVRLDQRSVDTLMTSLGRLTDPLARALCWGAAWDMTRDAELAARRWVQLVAEHADGEGDVGILTNLLQRAEAAIDRYGAPDNRAHARTLLAQRARKALDGAVPGSDEQLVWARAFASAAQTPEQRAEVRALLDGSSSVEGLAIDTDLRWHLLTALAAMGDASTDDIDAELRRDPTDLGARRAAAARAAQPLREAKEAAWTALLEDRTLPLATMRATVAGFSQPGQSELLAEYAQRYTDVLPDIWAQRSPEEALLLTGGLFPVPISEQSVAVADRALELAAVPSPGRRIVAESRDATLRALRARAVDVD